MDIVEADRITNRHIGRLLGRIKEIHVLPEIVADDFKREMHRLKEDLIILIKEEGQPNAETDQYNR